jgi:hypothetical protein
LDYNIETMRITDPGEEAGPVNAFGKANLLDSIKAKSAFNTEHKDEHEEVGKITADVQGNKLKALLGQIKTTG